MAIIKTTTTPHGIQADYFKLIGVNINVVGDLVSMHFAIYASAEARDNGSIPLWNEYVNYKLSELNPNPLEVFYSLAAQSELLQGGTPDVTPVYDLIHHVPPVITPVDPDPLADDRATALRNLPSVGAYKGGK